MSRYVGDCISAWEVELLFTSPEQVPTRHQRWYAALCHVWHGIYFHHWRFR